MTFQMGESRPKDAAFWFDPFAAYRLPDDKAKKKQPPTPIRPVAGRVLWREYAGLFLQNQKSNTRQPDVLRQIAYLSAEHDIASDGVDYPFRCVGIRTDMKAKIFEWVDIGFDVSPKIIRDPQAGWMVQEAIDFAVKGEKIIKQVFRSVFGGPSAKNERYKRSKAQMATDYWRTLSPYFYQYIVGMGEVAQREDHQIQWVDIVVNAGLEVFRQVAANLGDSAAALHLRVEGEAFCRARLYKARNKQKGE